ncbi:hypothetical protein B0H16DRAFT_1709029 [Mycena metata]|uniref:Uncharacterized protein n=1 Tax=Mycena metata TaxID=1033252 RepID=A0AAD7KGN8_9AGAR|nr:hypothetical protein B0H16DRAFT_1709029 [Mycena metata]
MSLPPLVLPRLVPHLFPSQPAKTEPDATAELHAAVVRLRLATVETEKAAEKARRATEKVERTVKFSLYALSVMLAVEAAAVGFSTGGSIFGRLEPPAFSSYVEVAAVGFAAKK